MRAPVSSLSVQAGLGALHAAFLSILPRIELHGRVSFRHVRCPFTKEDCIAEMVAVCWRWFVRLVRRGKDPLQFPTALASYAARAVKSGRRVCGQERARDTLSRLAQRRHGFTVSSLPGSPPASHERLYAAPRGRQRQEAYEERLWDNTVTPVPDQVAFRLDWPCWLATQAEHDRRLIDDLALGERTLDLARRYGVSPARISQKRRQFHDAWARFCGDPTDDGQPSTVSA